MTNHNILIENYIVKINKILSEIPMSEPKIIFVDIPYQWAIANNIAGIKQDDIAFSRLSQELIIMKTS